MGKILKRIKIKFNEIEHGKAGRICNERIGFDIDKLFHGVKRHASGRMLTARDLFGKLARVERKLWEKGIEKRGFSNA